MVTRMIRDILSMQKRELEVKLGSNYVQRTTSIDQNALDSQLIKVIIGPRRAGKSFFALHFLRNFGTFGYINFDDENLVEIENYDELIAVMNSVYDKPKYLLLDEIQNLPKWELFVNRLQRQGHNIIITGSNSNLLSRELSTHLTGRHLLLHILPFSFKEVVSTLNKDLTSAEMKTKLDEYLTSGGYPEPFIKNLDVKEYLQTLLSSIIFKDIVKRHKIRFSEGIDDLTSYLLSNAANEFSYTALAKVTKCKSVNTVEKYLKYLEEAFLFFTLTRFSFKLKNQLSANKKIYCIDNGLISAKAFSMRQDIGKLYENLVAIELKKQEIEGKFSIYYWKNQQEQEVDFIVKEGIKIRSLVQVCYSLENPETKKREIRALLNAGKELMCDDLLVLNSDYEGEETLEWFGIKGKIKFVPLWKWLLEKK